MCKNDHEVQKTKTLIIALSRIGNNAFCFDGDILSMKFKHASNFGFLFLAMIILALPLNACNAQKRTSIPRHTASPATRAASPATRAASSPTPFDGYGLYESCSPNNPAICLSHLNQMAAAGFKLVIDYDELYGDASFQKAYLDHAQSVGMKVIVSLKNPAFYDGSDPRSTFPNLAQTCACTDKYGFIQYVVNLVKNYPALWGYYIGDEVDPADHDRMKSALADVVHRLDPTHPRLFIDNGGHAIAAWHGNSPFFDTAEVIGSDFYPVRDEPSDYPTIGQTAAVAAGIQAFANTHREDAAIVLQAFSYSNYDIPGSPYPTADQMESMLSQTLAHSHPRIILWYSYYDIMASDNPAQHWNVLKAFIARNVPKSAS